MSQKLSNILSIEKNNIGVLRLTLNDPDNKNSLSHLMMQKLIEAISESSKDNSVRVIIIASIGNGVTALGTAIGGTAATAVVHILEAE